jgi:hypothetical protein
MKAEQLAVVQGWDDTRATLRRWHGESWQVLRPWAVVLAAAIETWLTPDVLRAISR